jgi:hypothetical protein
METITVWPAVGIEVSADRSRTWVARAALDGDLRVVVELLEPIPGTAMVVPTVAAWWSEWKVDDVAIAPRSPSATLVQPLTAELGVLKLADELAMAVAHGRFRDLVAGDRLRVRGHPALTDAARQASERRAGGAAAIDRWAGGDAAPLNAAELACWALDIDNPDGPKPGLWF